MPPKRSRLHKKKGARRPGSRASDASSASDDAMSTDGGGADDEGDEGGDNMERLLNHPTTTLPTASHPPATGAVDALLVLSASRPAFNPFACGELRSKRVQRGPWANTLRTPMRIRRRGWDVTV